jgi:hypothetical protein
MAVFFIVPATGFGASEVVILTKSSPNKTISSGSSATVYGSSDDNQVIIESGANVTLVNFPGSNTIAIKGEASNFFFSRSGATVLFEEPNGTTVKIPASQTKQEICFNDVTLKLSIQNNQVMLGHQFVTESESQIDLFHLSTPLPNNPIGLYFPIIGLDNTNYITKAVQAAAEYGLNMFNLVVHWKDLEPEQDGEFTLDSLNQALKIIREHGLYSILRIMFNGGGAHESAPSWFFNLPGIKEGDDYYVINGKRQPLPYSDIYFEQFRDLLEELALFFSDFGHFQPDGIQMSVGGDFGEQFLSDNFEKNEDEIILLLDAAKKHVDEYYKLFNPPDAHDRVCKPLTIDLILMAGVFFENEYPDKLHYNTKLIEHLYSNYEHKWLQTCACSAKLQTCSWGDETIEMFKPYITGKNMRLIIDEEAGAEGELSFNDKCPDIPKETVQERLNRIIEIEEDYDIRFSGITLRGYTDEGGNSHELTEENQEGISNLFNHFEN